MSHSASRRRFLQTTASAAALSQVPYFNWTAPLVAQDAKTGEVLILGYVNELALQTALKEKKATFWSTSRNELWIKGLTSGDFLELLEVRVNCEQNSILYKVRPAGQGACHTKGANGKARSGCYYRRLRDDGTLEAV